ncbi:flavin reductase family protein [Halomonas dongshanensis]|uniref:Flavin reductase family protein n=1 Tax=Halomonas dongshanensis TaxID=2890835 RepID=A0ABT2EJ26_9GAMM|nr:flavin reductase family protein [Halomonas dongshanensis]MCS2611120.1 flavin reductase family protein [Halomonas dongshanensis]
MIDSQRYKQALGAFPTGVTVVTALTDEGQMVGFTASAFSAVSMDPALVLVCPSLTSVSYPVIQQCKRFTIHILSDEQQAIAYQFASKDPNKSAGVKWHRSAHGNALIDGASAYLECSLWNEYPGGDHAILVGEVQNIWIDESAANPLLYCRGKMDQLPENLRLMTAAV